MFLPVIWSDNMFSLMPHESLNVTATFDVGQVSANNLKLVVELWNEPGNFKK